MKVAFFTLGCKVNQYEESVQRSEFLKAGFEVVKSEEFADIYVVNSCTVTAVSDKKTKQIIKRLKRQNDNALIALVGCMPQAFPEKACDIKEADVIMGSKNRALLIPNIKKALTTHKRIVDISEYAPKDSFEKMKADAFNEKTRAFVKIEDGCDRYCSYCIIPMARGVVRSKPLEDLRLELEGLALNGYREVVLVGINLSSYGKDLGIRLIDAIELACSINGIERVRLGSLEPELLTDDDILRMTKLKNFCPQFHLSLQSGCDKTLKRMRRHYDTDYYYNLVCKLRQAFDDCAITTDIMVGFAGESEEEFNSSLEFVKKVGFSKAHIFPYSVRKGTAAENYPDQVSKAEKERRSKLMTKACDLSQEQFLKAHIGREFDVLFEYTVTEEGTQGHTKNYMTVFVKSDKNISTQILRVKITDVHNGHCIGQLI